MVLATVFAYGSTLSNGFDSFTRTAGSTAAKVDGKTLDLNEQWPHSRKSWMQRRTRWHHVFAM